MPKNYGTGEFTNNQLHQIDKVIDASADLLNALLFRPEYLKDSRLKDCRNVSYPVHPSEIADMVANYISSLPTVDNVFYPTHFEGEGVEYVSDLFNEEEIYEKE